MTDAMDGDISLALISHLLRQGTLDQSDITEIADRLDADGNEDAGHLVRCALLEADAPHPADVERERARSRLRVISDGGKGEG